MSLLFLNFIDTAKEGSVWSFSISLVNCNLGHCIQPFQKFPPLYFIFKHTKGVIHVFCLNQRSSSRWCPQTWTKADLMVSWTCSHHSDLVSIFIKWSDLFRRLLGSCLQIIKFLFDFNALSNKKKLTPDLLIMNWFVTVW